MQPVFATARLNCPIVQEGLAQISWLHNGLLLDKVKDPQAHWEHLRQNPLQPTIGRIVDEAMEVVARDNPPLKGLLARDYACPALDNQRLGHPPDGKSRCGTAGGRCFPSTPAVWAG
jgi:hypothetical protein